MSDYATIARPYARAAFDYAKEHNRTDEWFEFLSMLEQVTTVSSVLSAGNSYTDEYKLNFIRTILEGHLDKNDELKKVGIAEIVSAKQLSSEQLNKIKKRLEEKYDKKFELVNTVDSSIIGGLILKIENKVIDESISGKLGRLSGSLLS